MRLTGLPANHTHFSLPFEALGVLRTGAPHFYRDGLPGESEEEFASRRAAELEALILEEGPETIAAFIAEPVNGAGGVVVPPTGYFEKIQAVLDKYDILLWDDEVICGFGRTGRDFGATTFNMQPKMMTLAKALSSAYMPVSAAVVTGDMYEAMVEPSAQVGVFGHGYTYSGHPVACAVASKVIDIYRRDKLFERAATVGEYMQGKLRGFEEHPLVGEVRGVGLIAALELVADTDPALLTSEGAEELRKALLDERWGDAVVTWMALSGVAVDVYTFLPVYGRDELPSELIGAQLQFKRLFRDA